MEEKTTQQRRADFPENLARSRERWEQSLENIRTEYGSLIPDSEDLGIGEWLNRLLWFLPLAKALQIRAVESEALSSQGFCFDQCSLCLWPHQATKSGYGAICSTVGPDDFHVYAHWHDYLRSDIDGKLEVVRAGTNRLFEGNVENTADYIVQMVESWKALGPPLR